MTVYVIGFILWPIFTALIARAILNDFDIKDNEPFIDKAVPWFLAVVMGGVAALLWPFTFLACFVGWIARGILRTMDRAKKGGKDADAG